MTLASRLTRVCGGGLVLAALLALATIAGVSAHESREAGGHTVVVGFWGEPATQGVPNGLDLYVSHGDWETGKPVEGLEQTLDAEVMFGDQSMPLEIYPVWEEPGHYKADFIPSQPGAYTFRIWGNIEGEEIDERFTGGPETFSEVAPRAEMLFPAVDDSTDMLSQQVADAEDKANTARTIGIAGVVAGVIGVLIGGTALAMSRRGTRAG